MAVRTKQKTIARSPKDVLQTGPIIWIDKEVRWYWSYFDNAGVFHDGQQRTQEKALVDAAQYGYREGVSTLRIRTNIHSLSKKEDSMAVKKTSSKKTPAQRNTKTKATLDAAKKAAKPTAPTSRVNALHLERNHSDEEILEILKKEYSDIDEKKLSAWIGGQRSALNRGRVSSAGDLSGNPIVKLVRDEKGKLIPYVTGVKKAATRKEKYTEANDPLSKLAGINVHKDVKKVAKKKVAKGKK